MSLRIEYISATIRLCILRQRGKKKRIDVTLLMSLHSYYCCSTLQCEKIVQTSSEQTFEKSVSAVCQPLGEKWISFPCEFLSCHIISSFRSIKRSFEWSLVWYTFEVTTENIYFPQRKQPGKEGRIPSGEHLTVKNKLKKIIIIMKMQAHFCKQAAVFVCCLPKAA